MADTHEFANRPENKIDFNEIRYNDIIMKYEQLTDRYIEAEKFIMEIEEMDLIDRVFLIKGYVRQFLKDRLKKYNF